MFGGNGYIYILLSPAASRPYTPFLRKRSCTVAFSCKPSAPGQQRGPVKGLWVDAVILPQDLHLGLKAMLLSRSEFDLNSFQLSHSSETYPQPRIAALSKVMVPSRGSSHIS